jgi:hypothetical protein
MSPSPELGEFVPVLYVGVGGSYVNAESRLPATLSITMPTARALPTPVGAVQVTRVAETQMLDKHAV